VIVSHEAVRRAVVRALTRKPLDGVQAAIDQAAHELSLPPEAVAAVIDATEGEPTP